MSCMQPDLFAPPAALPVSDLMPDLTSYDRFLVMFSGGKDGLACVADLLARGVPKSKIELWHHDVDGGGRLFMDWACTPAYCRAVAAALGLPIFFSHKVGGIEGEMMRQDARTQPMAFQIPGGAWVTVGGDRGKESTRLNWPAQGADLMTRWCSAYAKIDVASAAITNQDRFLGIRTLVITGERGQESRNRAKYLTLEPHRTDNRAGSRIRRHVDHWRPVLRWTEEQVWEAIRALGVVAHPAYRLGFGRLSCLTCIFASPNQWATIRAIFPERFRLIEEKEAMLGKTINLRKVAGRNQPVGVAAIADRGVPYAAALAQPDLVAVAESEEWLGGPVLVDPAAWTLPAGAYGESAGPV